MVLTVVCIFLPLSAIWAGVSNDSAIAYRGPDAHHRLINSQFGRGSSATAMSDGPTAFEKSRQLSACTYANNGDNFDMSKPSPAGKRSMDGDDGIHIGREFIVRHEIALEHV